jgi:hypothetical protein
MAGFLFSQSDCVCLSLVHGYSHKPQADHASAKQCARLVVVEEPETSTPAQTSARHSMVGRCSLRDRRRYLSRSNSIRKARYWAGLKSYNLLFVRASNLQHFCSTGIYLERCMLHGCQPRVSSIQRPLPLLQICAYSGIAPMYMPGFLLLCHSLPSFAIQITRAQICIN